jgi:hypothetical protein
MELAVAGKAIAKRPIISAVYLTGLILALFASGFLPDEISTETFLAAKASADLIDSRELPRLRAEAYRAEEIAWNARGWFSCDASCREKKIIAELANTRVIESESRKTDLLSKGKHAVGIWSTFGVAEIRREFWEAWKEGTESAQRMTMFDAFQSVLIGGHSEDTILTVAVRLILKFAINLTLGLLISTFMFLLSVMSVIYSYGPNVISGTAFYLLLFSAVVSVVASFFGGLGAALVVGASAIPKRRERIHYD